MGARRIYFFAGRGQSALPDPVTGIEGVLLLRKGKGMEGKGKKRKKEGKEGKGEGEGGGRKGMGKLGKAASWLLGGWTPLLHVAPACGCL